MTSFQSIFHCRLFHGGSAGPIEGFAEASLGLVAVATVGGSAGPIAVVLVAAIVGGDSGPMASLGGSAGPMLAAGGEGPMDGPMAERGRLGPIAEGPAGVCTLRFLAGGSCGPLALCIDIDLVVSLLDS